MMAIFTEHHRPTVIKLLACWMISAGCSSSIERKDLDIASPPLTNALDLKDQLQDATAQKIFDWQHHFRAPPKREEVEKITESIERRPEPTHPEEILQRARNLNTLGRLDDSEATYRRLLRLNPRHFQAHLELAQLCLMRSQVDKAFDYIVAARKIIDRQEIPSQADVFTYKYTLALAYLSHNRRDEGHAILSELITIEPGFTPAYVALAASYLSRERYELAEFAAKRGIDRADHHPDLMNILAVIAAQQGDFHQARTWYDRILKDNPEHVAALVNRANLSLTRQEFTAAESDLQRAIGISMTHVNAHIALGILYKQTGRFTLARSYLQRALDLNPESSYARFNLAILMAEQFKDRNTALRLFYEVLQTQDDAENLRNLARNHIQGLRENRLDYNEL